MTGGLGFLCSLVGQERLLGTFRFTFDTLYLWHGLPIIPVVIGLFAIPETIDLAVRGTSIASDVSYGKLGKGVREGIRDTFRHFWLVIRCSLIGTFVGILPGLGGGVAQWLSYAHAVQSAKSDGEREGFGKGDIRGVLGPGASNNSKEGANLIPTVAFGIPAGAGMAVLLAAFFIMGIVPGPEMLTKHLALTYSMVWTIVLSNMVVVPICLIFINHLAKLTTIRGQILIPLIILLAFIGSYVGNNQTGSLVVLLVFGALGYFMVLCGWPRPPFILGFVLGSLAESYLYSSVVRYEYTWLYRPKVIILFFIAVAFALYPWIQRRFFNRPVEAEE